MYLRSITLRNFRSFDNGEIELQKDLTVFVGENNGGKSNAIDAIRLLTRPLDGRRDIYCEPTDVRFQSDKADVELEVHFAELNAGQQGRLISAATDATLSEARFGLRFRGGLPSAPPTLWAGKPGNAPELGCQDMVRHVYLPPLRDAKRALASGNPTRIMALLNHFLGDKSAAELARDLGRKAQHDVLSKVDKAVGKGLSALTSGVRRQTAELGFGAEETLVDIARDLRFKLADHGLEPEDLRYSGHGYANLLFMAAIAVELEKARNADLTLFLVEEPEAHLHPQLQAAVLAFLNDQAELSRTNKPEYGPAGQVQVIVASHSPNLSAWVSSKQLVVFKSMIASRAEVTDDRHESAPAEAGAGVIEAAIADGTGQGEDPVQALATTAIAAALRRSTRCIPLAQINLPEPARRKIDRYLDVTKVALLFGGRVLLVEGIAEALLLPVIAQHHTLKNEPEKLRLFKSAVFAPIDGVDFQPYAQLLTTQVNGARIAERVVVMTDGDRAARRFTTNGEEGEREEDMGPEDEVDGNASDMEEAQASDRPGAGEPLPPGERRKAALDALAATSGASDCLMTITSTYSLEADLLVDGNNAILRKAFTTLRPRSGNKWDAAAKLAGDERAQAVQSLFKDVRKGDFAQVLAELIGMRALPFTVPAYIDQTIRALVA